jgi:hypothetical protein
MPKSDQQPSIALQTAASPRRSWRARVENMALVPVQSPKAMATTATPGPAVAPRRNAVTAAQVAPAATAANARQRNTYVGTDAPRPSRVATVQEPKSDAPDSQRYRKSSPVLTARMSPNVTGTMVRSAETTSSSWRRRELGMISSFAWLTISHHYQRPVRSRGGADHDRTSNRRLQTRVRQFPYPEACAESLRFQTGASRGGLA